MTLSVTPLWCGTECRTLWKGTEGLYPSVPHLEGYLCIAYAVLIPDFYRIFFVFLIEYGLQVVSVIAFLIPFETINTNKGGGTCHVKIKFEPRYISSEPIRFKAMVPLLIINRLIENGIGAIASYLRELLYLCPNLIQIFGRFRFHQNFLTSSLPKTTSGIEHLMTNIWRRVAQSDRRSWNRFVRLSRRR